MKRFLRSPLSRARRDGGAARASSDRTARPPRRVLRTARCVLMDEERFLLVVHAGAGRHRRPRWGLPGGHIDPGEAPHRAVCRELREELELEIGAVQFVDDYRSQGNWHRIFTATFQGGIERFDRNELLEIGWFGAEEVAELAERGVLHAGYEFDVIQRLSAPVLQQGAG